MSVRYQLSDKRDQAILVIDVTEDSVELAEATFAAAVGIAGLGSSYESFSIPNPVAAVPAAAMLTRPQQDAWGNPPVQPYQQAPQMPAAAAAPGAAPVCQHGTKLYREGTSASNGRPWKAWFCPAPGNDATQCAKDWIR